MSKEIKSIDDLQSTAVEETAETKEPVAENKYVQAAIDRAAKKEEEEKAAAEAYKEEERRLDGREYEYEVEGFNIGDAIVRRARTLDTNGQELSDALLQEDIEADIEKSELDTDEESFEDELSDSLGMNDTDEDDIDDVVEDNKDESSLPSMDELDLDDEDFDFDLDEIDKVEEDEDDQLSDEEMKGLRDAIKEKLKVQPVGDGTIKVSQKAVSLSTVLSQQNSSANVVDYPLMSAGRNVSMREFSGTEIDNLNRGASGRNRFNTLKEIYHSIWDHIVDANKPDFETWLKVTSFMDIDHYYMAIYKASFHGANYIPFNCTNDKCNHIFLSDDIEIEDMIKFKDDNAKKKFHKILEGSDTVSKENACLYETKIVPISKNISIGFREPSIYNTIFENSVLSEKFINKYTKLLTMMVYIDNIYLNMNGEACPVYCKKDKNSIAKTTQYRIATFAKIIKTLSSDEYNNILAEITKINDLGDEVKYQLPEITCPKCGETIKAVEQSATQLLFSRHQLNLLSQEY